MQQRNQPMGSMQDWTLRVARLIDHAAREHPTREIVSRWADGSETRTNWAGIRHDALRMTQALRRIGIQPGDRIATLAMNHHRHLVSWYGAVGVGGILHTINPRLFEDQLDYIVNHAEDRVMLFDKAFAPLVARMKPRWPTVERYICFDSGEPAPHFEDWIAPEDGQAQWADGDERDVCMLCYTSGTTGNPKGVLYEHRSTMLHAMSAITPPVFGMDTRMVMLPIVPMFHAASWGLPWAGAAAGSKLVFSAVNEGAVLCDLINREHVTAAAGVPTVWLALLQHVDATDGAIPGSLKTIVCGGSAMPRVMVERFMRQGIRVNHAWGMTETSPVGTAGTETLDWEELSLDQRVAVKAMQGRPPFGIEIRCVDLGNPATVLPRDGKSAGALQIRGPWVVKRYFKAEHDAVGDDQWFDTGDVGIIHPEGTLRLTDRTKDVIKSGGEWISSVELENVAMGHPAVAEAAAIGIVHPKWGERPLLVVVTKQGAEVTQDELRNYLRQHVAKWWVPDAVAFVDAIPHTGTGKISKKDLRELFREYQWPV
ncbi:long-chain fatty acid--CoA ligase [Novosphingobium sp. CECT 9465]|uniref:long-chain fatty acid--CoA ligase n=1 Tax=Novosphingobium sp. CECT 9465 TaxID=2829794 RepID=UPI001E4ACD00|nr:long-chain fatty acid--CoA ligase [Novosphingobium sp. CECT 9465]CAH0496852.1 3-methylmercaptopropionyl-CoA ligase [Novosphingobium sp. CECT 9465]